MTNSSNFCAVQRRLGEKPEMYRYSVVSFGVRSDRMQAEERLAVCFMSARAVRRDATQATPITRLEMFSQHNNVAISGPRQQTNFVQCEERQDERLDLDLCGFSHCVVDRDVG